MVEFALAAEVTMPKLVIDSVKPPYTILFMISTVFELLCLDSSLCPYEPILSIVLSTEDGPASTNRQYNASN